MASLHTFRGSTEVEQRWFDAPQLQQEVMRAHVPEYPTSSWGRAFILGLGLGFVFGMILPAL